MTKLLVAIAVLCLATLLLGASEDSSALAQLSPGLLDKIASRLEEFSPGIDAEKIVSRLMDLPNELLYELFSYLSSYEDWLVLDGIKGNARLESIVQTSVVSKMVIVPRHTGKPIPPLLTSVHASIQDSEQYDELVISRLGKVLGETTGIKSIVLDDLPIDSKLLELMYRHAESLERLSVKFITRSSAALQRGWLRRFTKLVAFEFYKSHQSNIDFPADFELLTELVYLDFEAFEFSLPPNAFQHLSGLKYLRLEADSIIYFLPDDIFKPLASLRVLILEHNAVDSLGPQPFGGLASLERLVLRNAHHFPYRVNSGTFSPLEKLTSVKLENSDPSKDIMLAPLNHRLEPLGFVVDVERREFIRSRQVESK